MYEYGTFAPTLRERVPRAYLIPAGLEEVLTRLAAHGIALEPAEATPLDVEAFRIDSVRTAERGRSRGTTSNRSSGATSRPESPRPPETCVVRADQPLGRLLFSLVEPRSDDGFANWGFLADRLRAGELYPILRVPGSSASRGGRSERAYASWGRRH